MNTTVDPVDPPLADRIAQLWNDSSLWLFNHSTQIALAALIGAVIVLVLVGAKTVGERICATDPERSHWRSIIGKALSKTRLWFMVATAAQIIAVYAHAPADIAKTVYFLFVIAAALQGAVFARALLLGLIEHRAHSTGDHAALASAMGIIRLLLTFALFAVAVILILSNLGVNVTGLVAGLGIGGIAIGLAAQGIFRDLFAAMSIIFDKPFRVHDLIKFGDVTGRVEAIGLKTTRIRSLDGEEVIMSNDKLLDQQIRNFHGIASRRIVLTLPLQYANDPDRLATLPEQLKTMVAGLADCRFDHALLTDFRADAVTLELMLHSTRGDAAVRDDVRHLAMIGAMRCLRELDIAFNYPAPPPQPA